MDGIVHKAIQIIHKLQNRYGFNPQFYTTVPQDVESSDEELPAKQEPSSEETEGEWCLVDQHGSRYTLPKTMIFLGREECDIEVQTFVNDHRIPEQEYVALDERDTVRLGYDILSKI
ncbi:hypothetical protein ACJMK2_036897 [Sinanodonta woodiana]|uniref:Uncharacterized protein n=1 Tax=Sinanodonta woodiana TaxID=1069815 RepID=A0ABD3WIL6_SINWO